MRKEIARRAPDALVAEIASHQHGVISVAQLRSAGLSPAGVTRRTSCGLHRIHRGVYAVGHLALSKEGSWMAAVLAYGKGAVLSHRSAAALWVIGPRHGRWSGTVVDVTVPGRAGRSKRRGIRLHRPESLVPGDCTLRRGIAVTTPARTLDDLRHVLNPAEFAACLREAEFLRLPVGDRHPAERSRTELESKMLAICRRHRLPKPGVNVPVDRYEVDFLWTDGSLIVEVDGWESHRTRSAFEEDRARDVGLKLLGYEVIRFTWRQINRDGALVAATIRTLLRKRS